ncbi:MAG: orotate phosphoribosyltransferase [Oscillospiraceae bacterium]|jgi:orotate phosphoribosyltransferase|nr:orotate phosphoribosyltransferase [Oscillospiraceae bacterium]
MSNKISDVLLKIKAIFLSPNEPFTWASGIKSPIYCDSRIILSYPEERSQIERSIASAINENFPEREILAGTSTAGIAHAAYVSDILNLPMVYVRGSEKDHGRKNLIEGKISKDQKVVVIEDLISTGSSAVNVVKNLRNVDANVLGVISIFSYNMNISSDNFKKNYVKNVSLSTFDELLEVAVLKKIISVSDVEKLIKFRENPHDFGWFDLNPV